ncbi:transcription factor EMB1444 [Trifolium repens]|nr:transcription factor EMB1444 [Trifolium repens]
MSRNLSPVLRKQLENLDKDDDSRKSAMIAEETEADNERLEKDLEEINLQIEELKKILVILIKHKKMMSANLHQLLRSLCLETDWKILTWEDVYYDNPDNCDSSLKSCIFVRGRYCWTSSSYWKASMDLCG